jgi:hypothetical protein
MATIEQKTKTLPAYAPYGTFKNFIESLKTDGIPARIDKTVMGSLAGGTQSHLSSALKFLELIDADGTPQDSLDALVKAHGGEEWSDTLAKIVTDAYSPVIGDLMLKSASPGQLTDRFRTTALDGATLDKAMRFYLQAMKDAKIPHSSHLGAMKVTTSYKRGAKPPKAQGADAGTPAAYNSQKDSSKDAAALPPGMIRYPVFFRRVIDGTPKMVEGSIIVPGDLNASDCKMLSKQLEVLVLAAQIEDLKAEMKG